MNLKQFQDTAINSLKTEFYKLWKGGQRGARLIFKAPTGAGKTIMTAEFLKRISGDAQFDPDKAFVWISFNPDLVDQSYRKLRDYLHGGIAGLYDTSEISQRGKLAKNDVLFVNWQKIVQSERSTRNLKLRTDGESTISFDTFIAETKKDGREIVLIVDEHIGRATPLAEKIIKQLDPRIELDVSATPSYSPTMEDHATGKASMVVVTPKEVINAGLIKESITVLPREDVKRFAGKRDLDQAVLDMAMAKHKELAGGYADIGAKVNPLVLIKLPNDEKKERAAEGQNKLDFTKEYLASKGVPKSKIAVWLDKEKINLDTVEDNGNLTEYLIFKQAAATGWDCPRADILVMFREIKSPVFEKQILGRILRTAEAKHYDDAPQLNQGYLYTTYERNDVIAAGKNALGPNAPLDAPALLKEGIENITLPSAYFERPDYNDLGDTFQKTFMEVADRAFDIKPKETEAVFKKKLVAKGFDLSASVVTNSLIVNAKIEVFDDFIGELKKSPEDMDLKASYNDTQKLHTNLLWREIAVQEEESKKYAPERSWGKLKSAINVWARARLKIDSLELYSLVCNDLERGDKSILRPIISEALGKYRPVRDKEVQVKAERSRQKPEFSLHDRYFANGSTPLTVNGKPCKQYALDPAYVSVDSDVELRFISYLESFGKKIDWWYKNGAGGRADLGIEYADANGTPHLFYPDFIVRQGNKIGIFDTKGGSIASEAKERAEALSAYIKVNKTNKQNLWGGIVVESAGVWYLNDNAKYRYNPSDLSDWKKLNL